MISKETIVPMGHHGQRVDVVLAQLFPDFSRSQLSYWLKEGFITLDQQFLKPKDKVCGGEQVKLQVTLSDHILESKAENIPLNVIFEDDHLLIINKPANLVVHPGAGNSQHTLVNALLYHEPSLQHLPRAGIVHRLDKDTTGLLIVAKTLAAHTQLIKKMQERAIQRHYLTLVYGHVIGGGKIDTFYGRHPRNRLKMAVCTQGKQAITYYSVKKHYHCVTLLDVALMTGRTHQIRVHFAHINHPVVGDQLYGGRPRTPASLTENLRQSLQQFSRQALHAYSLTLDHPISEERLTFNAPLPDDFKALLTLLDSHNDTTC